tara:strand:- start:160 stop:486 length:327 start_codon:yes stop_codon:yes gene_type:complete
MAQDLKKMTKAALESLGRQFGIELDRRQTKDKLIKQVKKAQKSAVKVEEPKVVEEAAPVASNDPDWKQYFTDAKEDTSGRWTVRTHRGRTETGFLNLADAIQWHKENE